MLYVRHVIRHVFMVGAGEVMAISTSQEDGSILDRHIASACFWVCFTTRGVLHRVSRRFKPKCGCNSPPMSAALSLSQPTMVSCTTPVGVGFASALKGGGGGMKQKT